MAMPERLSFSLFPNFAWLKDKKFYQGNHTSHRVVFLFSFAFLPLFPNFVHHQSKIRDVIAT
jgi:hypothetical protein